MRGEDRRVEGRCWRWPGSQRASDGRPILNKRYAYRLVWEMVIGEPIPDQLVGHHQCENPSCVNPAHIELITHEEHMARHRTLADLHESITHCPRGHEYTRENTYISRRGNGSTFRKCRKCQAIWSRRYKIKKRKESHG